MMKKILLIFTILSFSTIQVMALRCETTCSFKKENGQSGSANRDCCNKGKSKDKDKKHSRCAGEMNGLCLHELVGNDVSVNKKIDLLKSIVIKYQTMLISYNLPLKKEYKVEISTLNFSYLRHKSQVKIYLFQDQFLI
jgi:hypothetical protein